ncbi:hypothetical protein K1719_046003 [Acacia pycnantha]|nr:hypothetical protein K1719_046003 [Acacia pycnantha]
MALATPDIGDPGPFAPSTSPMKYDVFLSFYGADTRYSFADHLYHALSRKRILTFRDDQHLGRGQFISDQVRQAIEQSKFAIVVLSENYASSSWCLEELLIILESSSKQGQTVVPVFYGTDPSDVRRQRGSIAEALKKHEARVSVDKVRRWREALTNIANLTGWDTRNRHEAGVIEDIVEFVLKKFDDIFAYNFDYTVGDIRSKVDEIISLSKIGLDDICFVGIWGMGGVGKTTLARAVYEAVHRKFEAICFVSNTRKFLKETKAILCRTKVLIILDDVSDMSQLKILADVSEDRFTQSNSNSRLTHYWQQKMRSDIFLPTFMYHKLLHEASQESLHMHNVLQQMGRSIVYEECPNDARRRSRLWNIEDIDTLLNKNMGTDTVRSIVVDLRHPFEADWDPECFSKMRSLRLLDLSRVELAHNLNCLPSALKFLRWDYYALESLPPVDQLRELESLELRSSNIKRLWDRAPELHKLRKIDLSYSDDLIETPDFSGTPNLEKLFFNYCDNLIRVHESVGELRNLVELSLSCCTNLETLPNYLDMNRLEVFILDKCLKLEKLPEFSENMRSLDFLDVRNTKISEIPLSIINLGNLKDLDLSSCSELKSVPELPPNSIIHANKDPVLASALDLQLLIELRFSKHPSVAENPIHLVIDSKGKEDLPPWFEQQELCHSKDDSGDVVTITADIPSDLASSDGECWGIAVCIIFECPSEGAWRGFAVNWEFPDYPHISDKKVVDHIEQIPLQAPKLIQQTRLFIPKKLLMTTIHWLRFFLLSKINKMRLSVEFTKDFSH